MKKIKVYSSLTFELEHNLVNDINNMTELKNYLIDVQNILITDYYYRLLLFLGLDWIFCKRNCFILSDTGFIKLHPNEHVICNCNRDSINSIVNDLVFITDDILLILDDCLIKKLIREGFVDEIIINNLSFEGIQFPFPEEETANWYLKECKILSEKIFQEKLLRKT